MLPHSFVGIKDVDDVAVDIGVEVGVEVEVDVEVNVDVAGGD